MAFSCIIDACLQAMHNAAGRLYDSHVLNIMFWGSGGSPAAFSATVSWFCST